MNTPEINKTPIKFIKQPAVLQLACISRSALNERVKNKTFVPPIALGGKSVAFIESEVHTIMRAWVAGKTPEELQALVKDLVNKRQQAAA